MVVVCAGDAYDLSVGVGGRDEDVDIAYAALVVAVAVVVRARVPLVVALAVGMSVGELRRERVEDRVFREDAVAVESHVLGIGHDEIRVHAQAGRQFGQLLLAHAAGAGLELVDADDVGVLGLDQVDVLVDDEVDLVGLVRHFERQHVPFHHFQLHGLRLGRSRCKEQAA